MSETLARFRAGRLKNDPNNNNVITADSRKGEIRVIVDDQELIHFQWLERSQSSNIEDIEVDIITFPNECTFEKLDRPGSRVFILKFHNEPSRNLLFWAQEPNQELDTQHIQSVNTALNSIFDGMDADDDTTTHGPSLSQGPTHPSATPAQLIDDSSHQDQFGGGIGAQQLAAALGGIMNTTANPQQQQGQGQASSLSSMLANVLRQQHMQQTSGPSIIDILKPERVLPVLQNNPAMAERLIPYLPEGQQSMEYMAKILRSPQFHRQTAVLSHALESGQLNASSFGIVNSSSSDGGSGSGSSMMPMFGVAALIQAIQRQADEEKKKKEDENTGGNTTSME